MPKKSALNKQRLVDPTRTLGIRTRFVSQVNRRFRELKRDIRTSIIDNNCFDIRKPLANNSPINPGIYDFKRNPEKVTAFIEWLLDQESKGILEVIYKPGARGGIQSAWSDLYIKSAYEQGIKRALTEMKKVGIDISGAGIDPTGVATIQGALRMPVHADALGALYTRVFEDLKTVVALMNNDIRKIVADGLRSGIARGLGEGKSIETVARELVKDIENSIDKIGITRARLIARTETIRAHHLANINEYRQFDKDMDVTVKAEYSTANDDKVCEECASLEGKVFTLDEIEDKIPQHPNCVVGQTLIIAPDILAGMSANYSGSIVKLLFANGARLSVTPNHMLATPNGFIMAKFLSEGDTVFCGPDIKREIVGDPNDDGNPARIDNIIHALAESSGVTTSSMPVSAVNFHGDGSACQGNVNIVFADSLLGNDFNSKLREMLNGFKLNGRGIFDILFGDSSLSELIESALFAPDRLMGGSRDLLALLRGCVCKANKVGFATISDGDIQLFETLSDNVSGAAEVFRHLFDGGPRSIQFAELLYIYRQSIAGSSSNLNLKSGLQDFGLDGVAFSETIGVGQLTQVLPGQISMVSILGVEFEHVNNLLVYDLSTSATIYFANSILSSNCRCAAIPYIESLKNNLRKAS